MSPLSPPFAARPREDQFVADMANLFRRHRVRTGASEYISLLASVLEANDALRTDLLMLCNAISHMAESDLAPEELLQLVAKAVAGPRSGDREIPIPDDLRQLFISGWQKWQARAESLSALHWGEEAPEAETDKRSVGKFAAAASRKIQASAEEAPAAGDSEITPDTRIGQLTISQLRTYLDDIEQQVGRLQPYLARLQESLPEAAAAPAASIERPASSGIDLGGDAPSFPPEASPAKPKLALEFEPPLAETSRAGAPLQGRQTIPVQSSEQEPAHLARVTSAEEEEPILRLPLRGMVPQNESEAADEVDPPLFRLVSEPQSGRSRVPLWLAAALLLAAPAAYYGRSYLYPAAAPMPLTAPPPPTYVPPQNVPAAARTTDVAPAHTSASRQSTVSSPHLLPRAIRMEAQAARAQEHESGGRPQ